MQTPGTHTELCMEHPRVILYCLHRAETRQLDQMILEAPFQPNIPILFLLLFYPTLPYNTPLLVLATSQP